MHVSLASAPAPATSLASPGQALDAELGAVFERAQQPGPAPSEGRPRAERATPTSGAEWFVAMGQRQLGPLTVAQLKEQWRRGELRPESLCWREGLPGWAPLSSLPELNSLLSPAQRESPATARSPRWSPLLAQTSAAAATSSMSTAAPGPSDQAAPGVPEQAAPTPAPAPASAPAQSAPAASPAEPAPQVPAAEPSPAPAMAPAPPPTASPPARPHRAAWHLSRSLWLMLGVTIGAVELAVALLLWQQRAPEESAAPAEPPAVATPPVQETKIPVAPPPAPAVATPAPTAREPAAPQRHRSPPPKRAPAPAAPVAPSAPATKAPEPDPDDPATDDFDEVFRTPRERPEPVTLPASGSYMPQQLSQDMLLRVVLRHKPAVVRCVNEQRKREPGLSGTLVMRWTVLPSGRTSHIEARTPHLGDTYLVQCLRDQIESWTFPSHRSQGEPVDFNFKF